MTPEGPHMKWAVSLVIAYGHFNLPGGGGGVLCGYVWVTILTLSPPRELCTGCDVRTQTVMWGTVQNMMQRCGNSERM